MSDQFFRLSATLDAALSGPVAALTTMAKVGAAAAIPQVRVTFTSSEVGNGSTLDSNTMLNQDGGLAVRLQLENGQGSLVGPVIRTGDEGVTFDSKGLFTFDVRDLVSGVQRGDDFDVVTLGTKGRDVVDESGSREAYYINAGMGDDEVTGGDRDDFLVGGAGNDRLDGQKGDDAFIGGGGADQILGGKGKDTAIVNLATDGADQVDLGLGRDTVNVTGPSPIQQIRVTFTSAEVGNARARDAGTLANQDNGLAVRLQAEGAGDSLAGLVSRYDDEGISFVSSTPGVTFDVRDLVSGVQRGDQFDVVRLGTFGADTFNERDDERAFYINAGTGNDRLSGGAGQDFLVGGLGNDRLNGRADDDALLGGAGRDVFIFERNAGHDHILDFASGVDKIDLSALDVGRRDIAVTSMGADTLLAIDVDGQAGADLQIRLVNAGAPLQSDYIF